MVARGWLRRLVQRAGCPLRSPRHRLRFCLVVRLAAVRARRGTLRPSDRNQLDVARHHPSWHCPRFRSNWHVSELDRHMDPYNCPRRDRYYPRSTAAPRHMHLIRQDLRSTRPMVRSWDVFAFVRQGTYFERHLQNKSLSMLKPLHGLIGNRP